MMVSPITYSTDVIRNSLVIGMNAYIRENEYLKSVASMAAQFIGFGGKAAESSFESIEKYHNHFFIYDKDQSKHNKETEEDPLEKAVLYAQEQFDKGLRDSPEISIEEAKNFINKEGY